MRGLINAPQIGPATDAFPDGVIRDRAGTTPGTGLSEILHGDLFQSIAKLRRLTETTPNGVPDNEDNNFQMLSMFFSQMLPQWQPATSNVQFSDSKWVTYNNGIYYHRTRANSNNNPDVDTANWFRVLYWNGANIIFANENRIAALELTQTITREFGEIGPAPDFADPGNLYWKRVGNVVNVSGDFFSDFDEPNIGTFWPPEIPFPRTFIFSTWHVPIGTEMGVVSVTQENNQSFLNFSGLPENKRIFFNFTYII